MKLVFACCFVLFLSCYTEKKEQKLFELQEHSGLFFQNHIQNEKDFNILTYRNFYNGGGVAVGDLNNDGLPEVLFTANMDSNKLFLNKGQFQFQDITLQSKLLQRKKWATGVAFADINADGWLDIYICYAGYQKGIDSKNELYINNKNLTFTEQAKEYGLDDSGFTTHAAFFDYDLDGDLDVYILNNSFIPVNTLNYSNKRTLRAKDWPVRDFLKGGGDKLLRNDQGKFIDVSEQANIYGSLIGFGLGVTIGDVNNDAYPDMYISNDFFEKDYLYINQKNGTFKESLNDMMQHISHSSMGADMADINNDGYADIFVTDMLPQNDYKLKTTSLFNTYDIHHYMEKQGFYKQFMQNTLQLNNGNHTFSEIAHYAGVAASDWSWGGLIFDANNDGLNDIFVSNGINHDVTNMDFMDFFANDIIQDMVMHGNKAEVSEVIKKMPSNPVTNCLFINTGNLKFDDQATTKGMEQASFSNGAAYADLDNDGDLDLLVNNVNQPAFVYKNLTQKNDSQQFIRFVLSDTITGNKNRFCIGAKVKVFSGTEILNRELIPNRGFQSSVDFTIHIGLGKRKIDSIIVQWQDGSLERIINYQINQNNILYKKTKHNIPINKEKLEIKNVITLLPQKFLPHQENSFVDFYQERGIPMMLSQEGPKAAIGDVNGDGQEDIYICGAAGQTGNLYIQKNGHFETKIIPTEQHFADIEETATSFFDANGDGFLDLWIAPGGNEYAPPSVQLANRLYLNDGKGNFSLTQKNLPFNDVNVSVVLPLDFDNDKDMDVLIAGRNVPQQYGINANSYLLENDGKGNFTLFLQDTKNPFEGLGMITAVAFDNVLSKEKKSLVFVGEWMSPLFFDYTEKKWQQQKTNLQNLKGWWQSIAIEDFNNDGLKDLILGNIGENFYLQANPSSPIKLWLNDFDNNGSIEKIITRTIEQKDVPVFLKKEVTDQIPSLKKENLNYASFATKSIQNLFSNLVLEKSSVKEINTNTSLVAMAQSKGQFLIQALPQEIQYSSVNAIQAIDMNHDGYLDLVLGGNNSHLIPQFSNIDASFGSVILNNGKGKFEVLKKTNWVERGDIKEIKIIQLQKATCLLILKNNATPLLYQINASWNKKK